MDRRGFLKLAAALGAPLQGFRVEPTPREGTLAILDARVLTLEPGKPEAQAVLVRDGRIALVGTNDQVRAEAAGARVLDARGRAVVPGFIDSHVHLELACAAAEHQVACHAPPFTSLAQLGKALRAKAADTPAGRWVVGRSSYRAAAELFDLEVDATILGGDVVFEKNG